VQWQHRVQVAHRSHLRVCILVRQKRINYCVQVVSLAFPDARATSLSRRAIIRPIAAPYHDGLRLRSPRGLAPALLSVSPACPSSMKATLSSCVQLSLSLLMLSIQLYAVGNCHAMVAALLSLRNVVTLAKATFCPTTSVAASSDESLPLL
jgi:hypothetical protein